MMISYKIKGIEVSFDLERCDFVALFGGRLDVTDTLVRYRPLGNMVVVDLRVDESYALFAGLHECICCGEYGFLAPEGAEGFDRCGLIDAMLLECMPKDYAPIYKKKRIEMYKTLVGMNLNSLKDFQFKRAIAILEDYNLDG